jgi:hypothetical protein
MEDLSKKPPFLGLVEFGKLEEWRNGLKMASQNYYLKILTTSLPLGLRRKKRKRYRRKNKIIML